MDRGDRTMKNALRLTYFMVFSLFYAISYSATIKGVVVDRKKGDPLQGANVVVDGTKRGTFTNIDGAFSIEGLDPGVYRVVVSMIGYEKVERDITLVSATDVVSLNFALKEKPILAEQVVVTASRREESILNSPVSIGIYDLSLAQDRNIVSMDKAMNYAGGVIMNREQVSIRNSSGYAYGAGSRVLLLIDGIPLLAGDSGEIKWDAVPTSNVKRIEVVKQAGSALYGSNALGGVINVITDDPRGKPSTSVSTRIGWYEKPYYREWQWTKKTLYSQSLEISHSRRIGKLGLIFNIDEKTNTGYRQNDDFKRLHSFAKLNLPLTDIKTLTFGYNMGYEDHGHFAMWKSFNSPFERDSAGIGNRVWSFKGNAYIAYDRKNLAKSSLTSLKINTFYSKWNDNFSDEVRNSGNWSRSTNNAFYAQHNFAPVKIFGLNENTFTVGIDAYYSTVASKMFHNHWGAGGAIYGQDEQELIKNLNLNFGLRFDLHRVDSASTWTRLNPKLGLVYKLREKVSLRVSGGSGYRVPTIAELFTKTITSGLKIEPNPHLNPESAWSYEFGGSYFGTNLYFNISLFQNEYKDMIEANPDSFDDNGNVIVRFKNYTRARIRGVELETKFDLWRFTFNADYTYTNSEDRTLNIAKPLPYRPDHIVKTSVTFEPITDLSLSADYIYKSRVKRVLLYSDDPRVDAHILDLRGSYKISRMTLTLVCFNVLDYYYVNIERNINAPRNWSIGASFEF